MENLFSASRRFTVVSSLLALFIMALSTSVQADELGNNIARQYGTKSQCAMGNCSILLRKEQMKILKNNFVQGVWSHNAAWNEHVSFKSDVSSEGNPSILSGETSNFDKQSSCSRATGKIEGNAIVFGYALPCGP